MFQDHDRTPWASRAFKHRVNSDVKHVVLLFNNVSVHNKWHSHINLHQSLLISLQNIATCKLQDRTQVDEKQHKYSGMSLSHLYAEWGEVFSVLTARPDITMVTRLLCGCKWVAWTRCGRDVIMVKDAEDARVEKNTSQLKPCVACRRPHLEWYQPAWRATEDVELTTELYCQIFFVGLIRTVVQIFTCLADIFYLRKPITTTEKNKTT